jgi:eukaryotic-like serine/threonine-protein kinase
MKSNVAQYRVLEPLGRGATGVVYKAVDQTLDREVAIKVLASDLSDQDTVTRFRAEASALAKLNHPAIATVYELFRADADLLMVMEFVRGETLEQVCRRTGPMPLDRVVHFLGQILSALDYAHRAGVVHCDIKPANIMVTDRSAIKILDFGTARVRGAEHANADGMVMGTPAYIAPEQLLGHPVDGRADLYAVGVVFYRLVTGTLPFRTATSIVMMQKQLSDTPPPISVHRPGLPEWTDEIVRRALAKKPADRFQTADEFREFVTTSFSIASPATSHAAARATSDIPAHGPVTTKVLVRRRPTSRIASVATVGGIATLVILAGASASSVATVPRIDAPTPPAIAVAVPLAAPPTPVMSSPQVSVLPSPPPAAMLPSAPKPRPDVPAPPARAEQKPPSAAPFVFEARALVSEGDRQRERECQIVLADGRVTVLDTENHDLVRVVPYDRVVSITLSHGRDPVWSSPNGRVPVAHINGGIFRFFRNAPYWLALRIANGRSPFVILRLGSAEDASRASAALEQRTGRTADWSVADDQTR